MKAEKARKILRKLKRNRDGTGGVRGSERYERFVEREGDIYLSSSSCSQCSSTSFRDLSHSKFRRFYFLFFIFLLFAQNTLLINQRESEVIFFF